jgi:peroxiredoxin
MTIQAGSAAPDFTLPSHTDQKVTLSGFRGRPVVVTFMPFAFTGG